MNRITGIKAKRQTLALKEPFETAKRRALASETVFVEISTEDGFFGLGSATPVQYVTGETVETVVSSIENAAELIIGRSISDSELIAGELERSIPFAACARAGIEIALVDALGKWKNIPSYELFGGKHCTVETDVTIPVVSAEHARELAARSAADGLKQFKVKVGTGSIDEDLARVAAIMETTPSSTLIIDANQGFTPDVAVTFAHELTSLGARVDVFEQPVERHDIDGLAYVTRNAEVPVYADESVVSPADASALIAVGAVSGINVKLMKSGFYGALKIAAICKAAGIGAMLGCMLEPRVGISAALHVACAAGNFTNFDLDADLLLAETSRDCFTRNGCRIAPVRCPGLGCQSA